MLVVSRHCARDLTSIRLKEYLYEQWPCTDSYDERLESMVSGSHLSAFSFSFKSIRCVTYGLACCEILDHNVLSMGMSMITVTEIFSTALKSAQWPTP